MKFDYRMMRADRWLKRVSTGLVYACVILFPPVTAVADPFPDPPAWGSSAVHFAPAQWPTEPANAADCGASCGNWKPYTRFQNSINDPRSQDPSNGGTAPQNYVNIASSCSDKTQPSIYYYLHQGATPADDVIMFRWRVEQIANTYATGPSAGNYSASNPWSSALWTVLFDIDGSGFRSLAAHLNGSSGSPATPIDMLAGIWSQSPNQSIDYINDPANVKLLGHNPTAFTGDGSLSSDPLKILNFHNSVSPNDVWSSNETTWDYGTSRARLISTRSCNEYFVDYQIPVAMLDASGLGGPSITRSTPISMMFCTANSLNNPFQKDCAINKTWAADSTRPAPFGDYISFDKTEPYSQPIVAQVTAIAPGTCGQDYQLTAKVQDVLAVINGEVVSSVKAVDFYYWYDADGSGYADEVGGVWVYASSATRVSGSMNTWSANWNADSLPKGRYLIGVQAVDDNTLVDDGMTASGVDNRTFSYLPGNAQSQIFINNSWISGQQSTFPTHSPNQVPGAAENWYGNPDVTGIQTAKVGVAINSCGIAPTLGLTRNRSDVGPGEAVVFTLTVSNAGNPDSITVDNLSNVLPAGFTYQNNSTTGDFGSANPDISGQVLSWNTGSQSIAANGSAALSFTAIASIVAGTYNDTATATTSFGDLASDPVAISVGSARLALSITPGSYSTSPSGQVTYTLNYSNPSTVAITGTTLSSALPSGTTFQSCSASCTNGASVNWTLGSLSPGASGSVSYVLNVGSAYASTSLTTSASLQGADPASNVVSTTAQSTLYVNVPVGAIAAFTLEKTANLVTIAPGGNVTYTLAYYNYGGAAASSTVLTDTLPAGMTFVSCSGGCSNASGTVTWNLGTVAASASGSVTVTASAASTFTAPNPAVNSANIAWSGGGPVTATVSTGVTGQACNSYYFRNSTANVGFDSTQPVATALPVPLAGDTGSSVTVTAPVSGAAFLEVLRFYQDPASPADTAFSGTVDSWIYIDRANGQGLNIRATLYDYNSISGARTQLGQQTTLFNGSTKGRLDFAVPVTGTLQKDHRLLWLIEVRSNHNSQTVQVQVQFNGTVSNAISGDTPAPFADSGANFCVTPPANLTLQKTVNLPTVPESTTTAVVYSLKYSNVGASSATNAVIVDTLPSGVTFTSATLNSSPITPTGSNPYTFAVGTVTAGASGTLLINASVSNSATGLLTNSASLTSDQTSAVSDTADTLVGAPGSGGGPTAPEIYLGKSASVTQLNAGDAVVYTLTVVNAGNGDASNVVVTDDFPNPAYFSYVSCTTASGSCSAPGGVLSWNVGTLLAGGSATLTYTMQAATTGIPNGLTNLDNLATVTDNDYCTGGSPPASCSSNSVRVSVSGNPKLVFDLTSDNAAVVPGDVIEYTLVVSNTGSSTAEAVVLANPIPDYTGFVAITSGTGSFDTINNRVLFDVGNLAAGATATYRFTVQVISPLVSGSSSITDTATASASNAATVSDTVSSTATAAPVMNISLSGPGSVPFPATTLAVAATSTTTLTVSSAALLSPGDYIRVNGTFARITAIAGNQIMVNTAITASNGDAVQLAATYSFSYQNSGNAAASNVQVSEPLPAGWLYVTSSPTATSAPSVGSNGTLSWSLGTVDAGASGTLQFVALPTASGSSTHTTTLTADGATNQPASLTTLVGGLTITKLANVETAQAGDGVDYTITVANSLAVPVNGATVKDLLPAGFTYVSANPSETGFENSDNSRPYWTLNVGANSSTSIQLTVSVNADAGAATYQNEVEVTAPVGVGVAQYDALAAKTDDVTVLGVSGLMSGYVTLGATPLAGVWVNFYENSILAYSAYTDNDGRFQQVLEAGSAWQLRIASEPVNSALLAGLTLTSGTDPESFTINSGDSISRSFDYSLTAPTVNTRVTNDTTPTLTGTYPSGLSGGVFTVTVNNVTYSVGADLTVLGNNWTLTIPPANELTGATYNVTATITMGDSTSSDVTSNELVIDITPPVVPTVNSLVTSVMPILTGTATLASGETLTVSINGATYTNVPVSAGNWTLNTGTASISSGSLGSFDNGQFYSVTATVTDAAGNTSTDITDFEVEIDNGAPVTPTVNSLATSDTTPTITGTATLGSSYTLSVTVNGATYNNVPVSGGNWSIDTGSAMVSSGTLGVFVHGQTYSITATVSNGSNSATDVTSNELQIGIDTDGDGIIDALDTDDDNDGIPDSVEGNGDSDGDGLIDSLDPDSDNDGVPDLDEGIADSDGDGIPDRLDLDSDNDGIPDAIEGLVDTDGDGVPDRLDLDSDNDGLYDLYESGLALPWVLDDNRDGRIDSSFTVGLNGLADIVETSPDSGAIIYNGGVVIDTDADGVPDFRDLDSDNDGIPDVTETGGSDPDGDGRIGTGLPTVDANGVPAGGGLMPMDTDGDGIPDQRELDADNDGLYDLIEAGGVDANSDGLVDGFTDINGDGFDDGIALFALPLPDTDGDGIPDYQDNDDRDNDGILDINDLDDDNDGIPDALEGDGAVDTDGDGIPDSLDLDSDNDGLFDLYESGIADPLALDSDRDGRIDSSFTVGVNGLADIVETATDSGVLNYNNGLPVDTDNDGIADFRDLDSDNDGIWDVIENGGSDTDNDGLIGTGVPSVNANGIPAGGGLLPLDANHDGIPDYRDAADASPVVVIRTGLKGIGAIDSWSLLLLLPVLLLVRVANKKYWLLVVLIPGMASAENDDEYNRRVYVGAGVGLSLMAPETGGTGYIVDDDRDVGYRIYAGYDWNSFLSVDVSLASLGTTTLQPTGEIDYAINSVSVLFYFYDEGEADHIGWAAYVKGGIGSIQNDANVPYERVNSLQIAYGIGAEYGWENGFAARVDLETYDEDASLLTAGLLYRFGGEKKPAIVAPKPEPIPQDDDLDGVLNTQDACPGTAQGVAVDARGCELDSDGDGVLDSKDQCPGTVAYRKVDDRGCEFDEDGDGVSNAIDECPNTLAGAAVNAVGCAVFETRIEGVNFKTGSAELTDDARVILDKVAEVLVSIPGVRIQVEAHTDNVGREKANQILSEARAKSVKEYLSEKGVTEDRLVAVGFGESRPIDDNNTVAGRAKNRRVEFSVITDTSR